MILVAVVLKLCSKIIYTHPFLQYLVALILYVEMYFYNFNFKANIFQINDSMNLFLVMGFKLEINVMFYIYS